jgi:hypothetical protein
MNRYDAWGDKDASGKFVYLSDVEEAVKKYFEKQRLDLSSRYQEWFEGIEKELLEVLRGKNEV